MTVVAAINWTTVASLATAFGTLVLAIATFGAIRSANAAARTAERALLAGLRPVLFPSRDDDPPARVTWGDGKVHRVPGGRAIIEITDDVVYLMINVRNVGAGIAVLHGWDVRDIPPNTSMLTNPIAPPIPADQFRLLSRDLFVPPDGTGFWQGGIREAGDPGRDTVLAGIQPGARVLVDLLYGDLEGGQRTISRFSITRDGDEWRADIVRHWHLDRPDPR